MSMKNNTPGLKAISALVWETLESQRTKSKAIQMYQVLNYLAPNALVNLLVRKSDITDYELRGSTASLQIPFPRTENLKKNFLMMRQNCGIPYPQICAIRIHC